MDWKNGIDILGLGQCGREKESNRRPLFFLLRKKKRLLYLFFGLENIASERVAGSVTSNVAENLQILRIMGYIEDPWRKQRRRSQHRLNISTSDIDTYFVIFSASHLYTGSCITSILLSSHVHSFLLRSKQGKCQGLNSSTVILIQNNDIYVSYQRCRADEIPHALAFLRSTTLTPSTETTMLTFFFFTLFALNSYCKEKTEWFKCMERLWPIKLKYWDQF